MEEAKRNRTEVKILKEKQKGFYDLCNLINKHKDTITVNDIIKEVCEEGWYSEFRRLGYNTIIRQINRHNKKFSNSTELPYNNE